MKASADFYPIAGVADFLNAVHDFRDAMLKGYRQRYGEAVFEDMRASAKNDESYLDGLAILLKIDTDNPNRPRFVGAEMSEYVLNIRDDGTFSLPYADCARERVWHGLVIEPLRDQGETKL